LYTEFAGRHLSLPSTYSSPGAGVSLAGDVQRVITQGFGVRLGQRAGQRERPQSSRLHWGATSTPHQYRLHGRHANSVDATASANSYPRCKNRGHNVYTGPGADPDGTSRAGTDSCIVTTRLGTDNAGRSANRCDTRRCSVEVLNATTANLSVVGSNVTAMTIDLEDARGLQEFRRPPLRL
jgi:hypothetical protein